MAGTGKIRVDFDTLSANDPTYKTLPQPLQKLMEDLRARKYSVRRSSSHALKKAGRFPPRASDATTQISDLTITASLRSARTSFVCSRFVNFAIRKQGNIFDRGTRTGR
jgi:hypothetical protein